MIDIAALCRSSVSDIHPLPSSFYRGKRFRASSEMRMLSIESKAVVVSDKYEILFHMTDKTRDEEAEQRRVRKSFLFSSHSPFTGRNNGLNWVSGRTCVNSGMETSRGIRRETRNAFLPAPRFLVATVLKHDISRFQVQDKGQDGSKTSILRVL